MKTVEEVAMETVLHIVKTALETGMPVRDEDLKVAHKVAQIAVTLDRKGRE